MNAVEERGRKRPLKCAVVRVLEERCDPLRDALQESLEAVGLVRAIQECKTSRIVSRNQIFKHFEGKP